MTSTAFKLVSKPEIEQTEEPGGVVVIRIQPRAANGVAPADEPIAVAKLKARFGIERGALQPHIESGALPVAKIGRSLFVKLSDVLALIDLLAAKQKPKKTKPTGINLDSDYACIAAGGRQ